MNKYYLTKENTTNEHHENRPNDYDDDLAGRKRDRYKWSDSSNERLSLDKRTSTFLNI